MEEDALGVVKQLSLGVIRTLVSSPKLNFWMN